MASGPLCVAVLLLVASAAYGQVVAPIPLLSEDPGIRFNPDSEGAPVKIEVFIELNCGDSAYAYPVLQEVQEYYGAANLDLVFQLLTLPYHRQAWMTTQGVYQTQAKAPEAVFDYMQLMFDNLGQLTNSATEELSEKQVEDLIGSIQEPATGIPADEFASDVNGYGSQAVRAWKYATRRGMAGTPWFVLNNVDLAVNPSIRLSFEDWRALLDPLIPTGSKRAPPMLVVDPVSYAAEIKAAKNMVGAKLQKALKRNKLE